MADETYNELYGKEGRLYHRKEVKEGDDLMAATRYGVMLRFASTKAAYDKFRRPIKYPKMRMA